MGLGWVVEFMDGMRHKTRRKKDRESSRRLCAAIEVHWIRENY